MKNNFLKIVLLVFLMTFFFHKSYSNDFNFQVTEIEVSQNGDNYKGIKRGKIVTDDGLEIISDTFQYKKKINELDAAGNVEMLDTEKKITIYAEKVYYLKNQEKIFTVGKTKVLIDNQYIINGSDMLLLRDKMHLSSLKQTDIKDKKNNFYDLEQFQYSINDKMLKGEKIVWITNYGTDSSDKYFFEKGFFDLKKVEFLSKDVVVQFNKDTFHNNDNDPRMKGVYGYGDEYNTYLNKAAFTSCGKNDKCPPWVMTSKKVRHDKIGKRIIYKDAWLKIFDIPVAYFPKFFHPDPTVKRQSGLLTPKISNSNGLGTSYFIPYFQVISDSKDFTIKPRIYDEKKFVLQSEYRQINKRSYTIADFSIAEGHDSNFNDQNDSRSHFFTHTKVKLGLDRFIESRLNFQFQKVSNDNYLQLFKLESPLLEGDNSVLESYIDLDLEHEEYDFTASLNQYETLKGRNSDRYQYALPSYNFSKNFDILDVDGSFNFNSSGGNVLSSTNVVSSTINNSLRFDSFNKYTTNGIQTSYDAIFQNSNTVGKNHSAYRNSPRGDIRSTYAFNMSYPLEKNTATTFNSFVPKLTLMWSPQEMKNNRSTKRRMDANNVFSLTRLGMGDSFESDQSLTVGLEYIKQRVKEIDVYGTHPNEKGRVTEIENFFEFRLAQVFRDSYNEFIPEDSTIGNTTSNIFGEAKLSLSEQLSLDYKFSLTNDTEVFEFNAFGASLDLDFFSTQFNFTETNGSLGEGGVLDNTSRLKYEDHSLRFQTRRNRKISLTEYYDWVYNYTNDCLIAGIEYRRTFYNDADIKPMESFFFTITIYPLATLAPSKITRRAK